MVTLKNTRSGEVLIDRLSIRSTFWGRFAGYMMRGCPNDGSAMLLLGTHRVHTLLMGFPLDLYFLDSSMKLLDYHRSVFPFSFPPSPAGCRNILEVPFHPGKKSLEIKVGDRLSIAIGTQP